MSPPSRSNRTTRVDDGAAGEAIEVQRDPDLERWRRSLERSRERRRARAATEVSSRRSRWRRAAPIAATLGVWWLLVGAAELSLDARERTARAGEAASASQPAGAAVIPDSDAIKDAWRYASGRGGLVSLAVIDSDGRMRSFEGERPYVSASVVKALLLAAELERLERSGLPLDEATRTLLTQMITISDNNAADAIYARVGDAGLYAVARRAGMGSFTVSGYWSNAQITAEDMARFMWRLDRVLAGPHREFGLGLLGGIVESQRWGIPAGAPGWSVRFKGGWRPTDMGALVHQAAELRNGDERVAVAVLTDGQPSQTYAVETLRGVADRLVGPLSTGSWDGRWRG
jgi:Beta-lactamase enzyme family